jgi:hypothetical protein
LVCKKLLSGIQEGKNVLDQTFLNGFLLKEDGALPVG